MSNALALFLIAGLTLSAPPDQPAVEYTVRMPQPWTHLFDVDVLFRNLPAQESLDLNLPVWRTGRYVVFDFASGIVSFSADDGAGRALAWEKVAKSTWRIHAGGSHAVRVRYAVYANEFSMRTRGLNDEHGFIDGTSVFMYAEPYRKTSVSLTIVPYGTWHVTTGMDPAGDGNPFHFVADGYDNLVDYPIEIGSQKDVAFTVDGKKHILSVAGDVQWDQDTVLSYLTRIVTMDRKFWGDLPYDRYVFMFHASPTAGGGTEHLNSAVMGIRPWGYDQPGGYRGFVSLVSHEFFHTWNVKRLRPKGMDPYDWMHENYYKELWIAEGGTSYMSNVLLTRAGLRTGRAFLGGIASAIGADRSRPGNAEQALSESSFDAWIKQWKPHEEAENFETDYYSKGSNVCMFLDLAIRKYSGNVHSLDDVFRTMYRKFPRGGGGYTVDDFEQVAGNLAGKPLTGLFQRYVFGTDSLPWEEFLSYAGLVVSTADSAGKPWIGISPMRNEHGADAALVLAGSPAYEVGVNTGDDIIALDGYRCSVRDIEKRINAYKAGDTVRLTVFRDNKLRDFQMKVRRLRNSSYTVSQVDTPTDLQKRIFESWTGVQWEAEKAKDVTGPGPEGEEPQ
jgi:predicted metalloprotease with PDZ domain